MLHRHPITLRSWQLDHPVASTMVVAGPLVVGQGAIRIVDDGLAAGLLQSAAWALWALFIVSQARRASRRVPPELTGSQWVAAQRAVTRGQPVTDPLLAPTVIRLARARQKPQPGDRLAKLISMALLVLTLFVAVILTAGVGPLAGLAVLPIAGYWLYVVMGAPQLVRRRVSRAQAAEAAALHLLEPDRDPLARC